MPIVNVTRYDKGQTQLNFKFIVMTQNVWQ